MRKGTVKCPKTCLNDWGQGFIHEDYGVFKLSREVEFGLVTLCQKIPNEINTLKFCSIFLIAMNKSRNIIGCWSWAEMGSTNLHLVKDSEFAL